MSVPPAALSVLMVASEAHPYATTGGLGEVTAALSSALGRLGHRVTLALPRYRDVDVAGAQVQSVVVRLGGRAQEVTFETLDAAPGVTAVFVDVPELFDRDGLYNSNGVDYPDNAWRFALFNRAVLEYARLRGERPSVIHAHDWQTGLVPVFQKMHLPDDPVVGGVPAVFTVHNLAFQGVFPAAILPEIGLNWDVLNVQALEYWGQISLLKGGINFSERITTVSPTYRREILTPDLGFGFDGVLTRRAEDLSGILNGIDVERWNPATDTLAGATFTAGNLAGKAAAKRALLAGLNLPVDPSGLARPVIALISRLTAQKGFDLIAAAADDLMSLDATWVMHGSGDAGLEEVWKVLAARHPDRVRAAIGYDEALEHRILSGADLFLMPSRYEPCGLSQMHSLRYGTVPVVHATGGLTDTVRDASQPGGNGFKFQDFTPAGLLQALHRALDLFHKRKEWSKIQKAGMKDDHSWDVSAREYVKVYEGAAQAADSRG